MELDLFGNEIEEPEKKSRRKRIAIYGKFIDEKGIIEYQKDKIDPVLKKLGFDVYYFAKRKGCEILLDTMFVDYVLIAPIPEKNEDASIKLEAYLKRFTPVIIRTREDFKKMADGEL